MDAGLLDKRQQKMKIRYSLLFIVMLIGCQKPILDVTNQLTWKTEPLNGEYTIQFPGGYEGPGMVGFEGPTFGKNRIDKQVTFGYFFCGPTTCGPYGQPIIKPYGSSFPSTIVYANRTLNKSITFKRDGQLQAVFYFSEKIERRECFS